MTAIGNSPTLLPADLTVLTHSTHRDALHQAIIAEGDTTQLESLDADSIAGAHIACSGYRKFVMPDDSDRKEVTYYKITTSIIQVGENDGDRSTEKAKVAQFVAWHRYTHFENLKKVIETYELGNVPALPSKHMFTSPDSRVTGFSKFLQTVVAKAIKRENTTVLEVILDFLGAKEDSAIPDFIQAQLEE